MSKNLKADSHSFTVLQSFRYDQRKVRSRRWLLKAFFLLPKYQAVILYRLSQRVPRLLSLWLQQINVRHNGVEISSKARIGRGFRVEHPVGIVVGQGVRAGTNLTLYHNVVIGQRGGLYPRIGDDVTVWPNAVVVGDLAVGDRAVIGAQSVVLSDVPSDAVVAGIPAEVIGTLEEQS